MTKNKRKRLERKNKANQDSFSAWFDAYITPHHTQIQHLEPVHYDYNWYIGTSSQKLFDDVLKIELAKLWDE